MGFRLRKSINILPGVRLTLTGRGLAVTVGPRGARLTASSDGRVTRTFSIPGSGLSHVKTLRAGGRRRGGLLLRRLTSRG